MGRHTKRGKQPNDWWPSKPTPIIRKYESFFDELHRPRLQSEFPYNGINWREHFKKAPLLPLWKLKKDYLGNPLGVDLIAMADKFFPINQAHTESAAFGGAGADAHEIWIPALDGGVFLEVSILEDQYTNALSSYQTTLVGGSACFRFLLKKLGFDPIKRRLKGEDYVPTPEESERMRQDQLNIGTEAHEKLLQAAANLPLSWGCEF